MNGKGLVGFVLIVGSGAFLLEGDPGGWFVFLLSLGVIVLGCRMWQRAQSGGGRAVGAVSVIIGVMLLYRLPFFIGLLMAAVCIYSGWTLIRRESSDVVPGPEGKASWVPPRK